MMLPYGAVGWSERIRLVEGIISYRSKAPFIYNDVLLLVPSTRMKRTYARLFLDALQRLHGALALIQPEIRTLHQFLENLYARLKGPRLIGETSRLILLEGIVKERLLNNHLFSPSPDLLAPSLSSAIAAMIEQLSFANVSPEKLFEKIKDADFYYKPQVGLLMDVYSQYQRALKERDLTDPAGMRTLLAKTFDPSWLAPYREIIIDGIQDADDLEKSVLRKIAARKHCTYLVEAPSQDLLAHTKDFHPLRITKDFIAALCNMPVRDAMTMRSDDLYIASTLFSDKRFDDLVKNAPAPSTFGKAVNVLSAVNSREEVALIAGLVKKSIQAGTPPDSILVAFPALDEYGPLIEEVCTDYGIPYNRALGKQLSSSPVISSVVSLLRACQEDFSSQSLLRIFNSPFLKFAEQRSLGPAFDRFIRATRITHGKEKLRAALRHYSWDKSGTDILAKPLDDLFGALEPFSAPAVVPLCVWMDRFNTLMAWSGLAMRVDAIHGPLNINLQAYRKLNETIAHLSSSGKLFPEYTYTFHEWLFLLKKTFMRARFQVPPEDEAGVQILGLLESFGRPWKEIYLGGLVDGSFPQHLSQNIFLPETVLDALGVNTPDRGRLLAAYHFYRLLLSAESVTLTWPENEGDRPVVPSPFLEELTPLRKAGLINRGVTKASGIQFILHAEESHSIPELAKAVGIMINTDPQRCLSQGTEWLTTLAKKMPSLSMDILAIKSAMERGHGETGTPVILQQKNEFWITEIADYINCPYDYYVKHVLGIKPLEDVTEDISPRDFGSKVHAILKNFYESWDAKVTRENRQHAERLLKGLADAAFDKEADTIRNRHEKATFLDIMAGRFLDAEEEFWKRGMRPAYLEQKIESFKLTLTNGEEVTLSAKIDRIDVDDAGNFIIVDYKTGKYPQPNMDLEQEIYQLPVYAVMALSSLSGGPRPQHAAPLKQAIGLAYYDLAGKSGGHARDVVLYNKDIAAVQPANKPKASPKSGKEFETILKQSMDKTRRAIEGILAGDFTYQPQDENKCRYCPNVTLCMEKTS